MQLYTAHTASLCLTLFLVIGSCVEPFDLVTNDFEELLVVDAKFTDEFKRQHVMLSRTRTFETDSILAESNSIVKIVDDLGNTYDFMEEEPGNYFSNLPFAAEQNRSYQLLISTASGVSYVSELVETPSRLGMGELSFERGANNNGDEGVSFLLNNSEESISKYRRYEYEETYKIIAPFYSPLEFNIIDSTFANINPGFDDDGRGFVVELKARTKDVSTCYNTSNSTKLILGASDDALQNSNRLIINFLGKDDFKISHRYSILVKQHNLTSDAYSYYKSLADFSSSESVFSQIQPGFLEGNIFSQETDSQNAIGFFEISSVSEKRLFFNYSDLFPDESLPPYIINCEPTGAPPLILQGGHANVNEQGEYVVDALAVPSPLIEGIQAGLIVYYDTNEDFGRIVMETDNFEGLAPYYTKATPCGDCTVLGSLEKPDFWID
ncbi:DUF4249 domain-containing protein [Maribacter sp. 2308TA10-17]|uniref:DUF4249 domain-containing protein n=1 Tax=Maribacter sp. 2308TA10-17 TaxID=3386276 RepID=UPI0039BCD619